MVCKYKTLVSGECITKRANSATSNTVYVSGKFLANQVWAQPALVGYRPIYSKPANPYRVIRWSG